MNNDEIRKYLLKELTPEETNKLEQDMENNTLLKDCIEGLEEWTLVHPLASLNNLETILNKNIDRKTAKTAIIRHFKKNLINYLVLIAVPVMISIAAWPCFFHRQPADKKNVYTSYFTPLTDTDITERSEDIIPEENKATKAYDKEDYFASVRYYEKLLADGKENVKNNLFLGISLLATNQPKKAIDILNNIHSSELYKYDILWYLALAYIRNKEPERAKSILYNLSEEENYYQISASEILDKLNGKKLPGH